MRIDLSRQELFICEYIGTCRRKNAMQFNKDRQVSKRDPYDIDIEGFMGEFIVAKHLGVMPDFSLNERKNPIDLVSRKGKTIDVKTTRNPAGKLYVTEYHRKNPCDIYILILVDDFGGDLIGWIDKESLFEKATYTDANNHPSYVLEQEQLNKYEQKG